MQKKTLIIIISVLVIILAVIAIVLVVTKNSNGGMNSNSSSDSTTIEPEVELTSETENGITTIYVTASIEGDNTILSITLPDGEVIEDDMAEYEVDKAGEYEFRITASNGTSVTKTITIEDLSESTADNPYIPDGFTHVSGTEVETGFIIEDESGNQYVWVPVESGILTRNTDGNSHYEESDSTASGLYNSVAKYYGFYIARYEASQVSYEGTETAASLPEVLPWSNITYTDAYEISRNVSDVYGYTGVRTALVNSYAWDSALKWMDQSEKNYSSNTSYGNYSGTILETGETETDEVNSICDMAGNMREWTTEIYYPENVSSDSNFIDENQVENVEEENNEELEENIDENNATNEISNTTATYRVIRGGSANINKVANSHIGQVENLSDSYWGFRIILYKD